MSFVRLTWRYNYASNPEPQLYVVLWVRLAHDATVQVRRGNFLLLAERCKP